MEDFKRIFNWENIFKNSEKFQNSKPFRCGFIENVLFDEFYQKLYDSYPDFSSFDDGSDHSKSQLCRDIPNNDDSTVSDVWNEFKRYLQSAECIQNFRKYTGVDIKKLDYCKFIGYKRGGFQIPHIHNVSSHELVIFVYFSKGWKKGDPGGTFLAKEKDLSTIFFEPHTLDNVMALFQDGPNAVHGTRLITKDVERRGYQIVMN